MAPPRHKRNIENVMPLDIRRFQCGRNLRDDWLIPETGLTWFWLKNGRTMGEVKMQIGVELVMLTVQVKQLDGSVRPVCADVGLARTPCGLGGTRSWWVCHGCGNRAAVLYFRNHVFACRKCHKLAYPSQSEAGGDRALRVAGKIRQRLGWVPGVANRAGPRPKGMHLKTFLRLKATYDVAARAALYEVARSVGLKHPSPDR